MYGLRFSEQGSSQRVSVRFICFVLVGLLFARGVNCYDVDDDSVIDETDDRLARRRRGSLPSESKRDLLLSEDSGGIVDFSRLPTLIHLGDSDELGRALVEEWHEYEEEGEGTSDRDAGVAEDSDEDSAAWALKLLTAFGVLIGGLCARLASNVREPPPDSSSEIWFRPPLALRVVFGLNYTLEPFRWLLKGDIGVRLEPESVVAVACELAGTSAVNLCDSSVDETERERHIEMVIREPLRNYARDADVECWMQRYVWLNKEIESVVRRMRFVRYVDENSTRVAHQVSTMRPTIVLGQRGSGAVRLYERLARAGHFKFLTLCETYRVGESLKHARTIAENTLNGRDVLLPNARHVDRTTVDGPATCEELLELSLVFSPLTGCEARFPTVDAWHMRRKNAALGAAFEFHRKSLAVLSLSREDDADKIERNKEWLLCDPFFGFQLDALTRAYSESRLVVVHRDVCELVVECVEWHLAWGPLNAMRTRVAECARGVMEGVHEHALRVRRFDEEHEGRLLHVRYEHARTDLARHGLHAALDDDTRALSADEVDAALNRFGLSRAGVLEEMRDVLWEDELL